MERAKGVGNNKRWTLPILLMALLLLVTACGSNTVTQVNEGDGGSSTGASASGEKTVFIGIVNPPTNFNPINQLGTANEQVVTLLNDSLLGVTETYEFVPRLAKSVETADNKTFVFKLQDNAKWTDGTPFTTKDVEFTVLTAANPAVSSTLNLVNIEGLNDNGKLDEGQTSIAGLRIIDDLTFEVETKSPVDINFFNDNFSSRIRFLPEHVLKDVNPADLEKHEYMSNPTVTVGQFKFVKFAKDQYVEYAANPDYYLGAPKISKLFVKIMPASNLAAQLQTGEIDMNMIRTALIPPEDYQRVSNMSSVNTKVSEFSIPQTVFINNGSLTDPKVREAILYGTNRQIIVEQLLKGNGEYYDSALPKSHPYYNSSLTTHEYDPEKAKQLLQEAGWDFNKPINFVVPTGNKVREQAAELMAATLTDIGLNVQIQKFDFPTAFQKVREHDYDLAIIAIPYTADPTSVYTVFGSGATNNYENYQGTALFDLLDKGSVEVDTEKRKQIYFDVQKLIYDETVSFTILAENPILVTSKMMTSGEVSNDMLINAYTWDKE